MQNLNLHTWGRSSVILKRVGLALLTGCFCVVSLSVIFDRKPALAPVATVQVEEPADIVEETCIVPQPAEEVMDTVEEPVEEPAEPVDTAPAPVYTLSAAEYDLFVRIVYLEGGTESLTCKEAIASVIMNRVASPAFPNTLTDVIYAENQFTTASIAYSMTPYSCPEAPYWEKSDVFIGRWDDCYTAVDYVLQNGSTLPAYVTYFRASYYFEWATPYTQIDNTFFSY